MTLQSYKIVYESSVSFGLRQAVKNESNITDMKGQKEDVVAEKIRLKRQLMALEKLHELTKGTNLTSFIQD